MKCYLCLRNRPPMHGVPNGIRTRVLALKGPRPGPLDDGDVIVRKTEAWKLDKCIGIVPRTEVVAAPERHDCWIPPRHGKLHAANCRRLTRRSNPGRRQSLRRPP